MILYRFAIVVIRYHNKSSQLLAGVSIMKKIKEWLVFLLLTLGCSVVYAQDLIEESVHHYIRSTAIVSSSVPNQYDDFGVVITVCSLIIGLYVFFWFRQKT